MLITDVLLCPHYWCMCVYVCKFICVSLITQCLILLMFKDPLTTKYRFWAFENEFSVVVAISPTLII